MTDDGDREVSNKESDIGVMSVDILHKVEMEIQIELTAN